MRQGRQGAKNAKKKEPDKETRSNRPSLSLVFLWRSWCLGANNGCPIRPLLSIRPLPVPPHHDVQGAADGGLVADGAGVVLQVGHVLVAEGGELLGPELLADAVLHLEVVERL